MTGARWRGNMGPIGYRLQVVKSGHAVRLYSRNGHEWTKRLAALADALTGIAARSAVIDAQLCFPGADGVPDFAALQAALGSGRQHELAVFAFDLMYRDGIDLCALP
jgi:bifunctional non-homologous end joining protein LigD